MQFKLKLRQIKELIKFRNYCCFVCAQSAIHRPHKSEFMRLSNIPDFKIDARQIDIINLILKYYDNKLFIQPVETSNKWNVTPSRANFGHPCLIVVKYSIL